MLAELEGYPYCAAAHQYAVDVESGTLSAPTDVVLACRRYLSDLERDDFPYYFDPDVAERYLRFIQTLPHTRGRWARDSRKCIKLEPWQCFFVSQIFGWHQEDTGHRRFREATLFVPRKNGKSLLAAAIALAEFCLTPDYAPEIFSGATTEKQALEVFKPARYMCLKRPSLCKRFNISVNARTLTQDDSGGKFEPVIGKPGDGSSPLVWIVDEYHEHADDDQVETARTGMGSRDSPLLLIITTAGRNLSSPCYTHMHELSQMLRGSKPMNDRAFALMYAMDPDEDWQDPAVIRRVNPNLGVSVTEDFLLDALRTAKNQPQKQNGILTKHMNRWVNSAVSWLSMADWERMRDPELRIEDFRADEGVIAVDLARKLDLCALVVCFTRIIDERRHYYLFPTFWLPSETIIKSPNQAYSAWEASGDLQAIEGHSIDNGHIISKIKDLKAAHPRIKEVAVDPWKADELFRELEEHNVFEFAQRVKTMSPAMKEFESALADGRIHHDGHPILMWNVFNVITTEDAGGQLFPRKTNASSKIDGAIASLMAVHRCMVAEEPEGESNVERYGIRTL